MTAPRTTLIEALERIRPIAERATKGPGSALLRYRLSALSDPEERLEDAAMWKALHDEFGDRIEAVADHDHEDSPGIVLGRSRQFKFLNQNPVSPHLPYWTDPAFLARSARSFEVLPFDQAIPAVRRLHASGKGAFVKSTKSKHAIFRIPVGTDPEEIIGDMVYSFIDGGPDLMVQELCRVEFEYRFFVIDRKIVTSSPVQWTLTPIDRLPRATMYRTPRDQDRIYDPVRLAGLQGIAAEMARDMAQPHAVVDCGLINDVPGIVELNPMRIGEVGLYACNVRLLARAVHALLAGRITPDTREDGSTPTHPGQDATPNTTEGARDGE